MKPERLRVFSGCVLKKPQTDPLVDLHLHTHYSDGTWSPAELVARAIELKLACIAITDHDTVAGITEALEAAQGKLRIIPGIEINSIWKTPDGKFKDVHILGYFIDLESPFLAEIIVKQNLARQQQMEQTLGKLSERGIEISPEQVAEAAGKGSIGRPHLARILIEQKKVESAEAAYDLLMKRDSAVYVQRESVETQQAIEAIAKAGGVSSWAHPGKDRDAGSLLPLFKSYGLAAVEAYHRGHSHRLAGKLHKLALQHDLLVTGGSDCHGPYGEFAPVIGTAKVPGDVVWRLEQARNNR